MMHPYSIAEDSTVWLEKAQSVVEQTVAPNAADVDSNARFPTESIEALREAGFLGLCVPQACDGAGQGPDVFAGVVETIAQACGSTAMIYVMHVAASQPIIASNKRADVLKEMAAGKHLTTLAFSERGSRSQFWAPVSKLEEHEGTLRTNAFKSWVTSAHHADSYVCSAQKPGAQSPAESTLYLLPRDREGVRSTGGFDGLGLRGNDSTAVSIENTPLSEDDLLTEQGAGAPAMLEVVLPWFNTGTAAMAHGLCLGTIAATAKHLQGTGFQHTATRLRDLPNLRARLADMHVRTERSRALLGHTLQHLANPNAATPLYVLSARHSALETATEVTDLGMKACGGAAFSRQLGIERLFRDARAGWVMAPTVDHSADFIGRALTGMELF